MIRNVHSREVRRDAAWLDREIARIAEPEGLLWPSALWPPLTLDRPLGIGAVGGHGPIPYTVVDYEPGRRVVFEFDPAFGLVGTHSFVVTPSARPEMSVLRHEIAARTSGTATLAWVFAIRWLHDALIEDLLDRAEFDEDQLPTPGANWSPWVRVLRSRRRRAYLGTLLSSDSLMKLRMKP